MQRCPDLLLLANIVGGQLDERCDLFVPKPARLVPCLPRCLAALRVNIRRRPPLPTTAVGHCYSVGYSAWELICHAGFVHGERYLNAAPKGDGTMTDPLKSKAVVLYLWGDPPHFLPHSDPDAVRRLPVPDAAQLVRYVEDLTSELFEVFPLGWRAAAEPDPAHRDPELRRSVELVQTEMTARHPELDAEAAECLAWYWGYCAQK